MATRSNGDFDFSQGAAIPIGGYPRTEEDVRLSLVRLLAVFGYTVHDIRGEVPTSTQGGLSGRLDLLVDLHEWPGACCWIELKLHRSRDAHLSGQLRRYLADTGRRLLFMAVVQQRTSAPEAPYEISFFRPDGSPMPRTFEGWFPRPDELRAMLLPDSGHDRSALVTTLHRLVDDGHWSDATDFCELNFFARREHLPQTALDMIPRVLSVDGSESRASLQFFRHKFLAEEALLALREDYVRAHLERCHALARYTIKRPEYEGLALFLLGLHYWRCSAPDSAYHCYCEALDCFLRSGRHELPIVTNVLSELLLVQLGQATQADPLANRVGLVYTQAAWSHSVHRVRLANWLEQQILAKFRAHPTLETAAAAEITGLFQQLDGRLESAIAIHNEVHRIATERSLGIVAAWSDNDAGLAALARGRPEQAVFHFRQSLESKQRLAFGAAFPVEHFNIATGLYLAGYRPESFAELRAARQDAITANDRDLLRHVGVTEQAWFG